MPSNIFEHTIGDGQIKGSEPSFHEWEEYDPGDAYYDEIENGGDGSDFSHGEFWICKKCGWDLGPIYDKPRDDRQRKVMIHAPDHSITETEPLYCHEYIAFQVMDS
jgi:hypothetical protein